MSERKNGHACHHRPSKLDMPTMMLIEPLFFFASLFGGECGMAQDYSIRGTHICENKLYVQILQRFGAAYQLELTCKNPNHARIVLTSDQDSTGTFNVNKLIAVAGRLTRMKYTKTEEFMAAIGIKMHGRTSYFSFISRIAAACAEVSRTSKIRAAADLVFRMAQQAAEKVTDVAVSCDGTWLTRGQKSRHGIATVLSAVTHKVLDTAVESSYCTVCTASRIPNPGDNHSCDITHKGSAGSMEVSGLKRIFSRYSSSTSNKRKKFGQAAQKESYSQESSIKGKESFRSNCEEGGSI